MNSKYRTLVFAAVCLALCIVLPFFIGQIPEIGQALSPMHIPALLCGFVCGPFWGAAVGFFAPLIRMMIPGGPPFAVAFPMAFELAVYGIAAGVLYRLLPKRIPFVYVSLIGAMVCGRIVWGCVKYFMTAAQAGQFTFDMFIAGAITGAVPGIICHIILIPLIVMAMKRAKLINLSE